MFKKAFLGIVFAAIAAVSIFASDTVEIDSSVLDKAYKETYIDSKASVFWKDYNSGKQIRDMGRRLGSEIKYQSFTAKAYNPYASGYPSLKYKVSRIYPGDKAGADVLYINKNAGVNTIKNVHRILSGYIEKAYDVPMESADEIAVKVCYWNTNHYDDHAYFKEMFQPRVLEVFANRTKIVGLARSYKNWPGKTRIVIPFVFIKEVVPEAVEPQQQEATVQEVIPNPETEAEPQTFAEEPESEGLPILSKILLAMLILAILVVAVVLIRHFVSKKNNKDNGNS